LLNGQGYPLEPTVSCSNDVYKTNKADFDKGYAAWYSYATTKAKKVYEPNSGVYAYVASVIVDGSTVDAAMSIGHGVLTGKCGQCALIRLGTKYVAQFQTDVRAWSLELSGGANTWLAPDNLGGTCHIPEVMLIDCSSVVG